MSVIGELKMCLRQLRDCCVVLKLTYKVDDECKKRWSDATEGDCAWVELSIAVLSR